MLYYEKSFQDPQYKKLTVLELLKKLNSSIFEERVNASWMLLKIVDCHPLTLFENISKLNNSLNDENKKVSKNIARIIEFLAYKEPKKIASSIPNIVNLLDDEDPQLRFTASLIFKAISRKYDKFITIPKLLKLLADEKEETRLNAVTSLIELTDQHLDKVMPTLYQLLKNHQIEVSELIFKISSKYPKKAVKTLIPHLKNKKNNIRRITLIFLNNLAGKNLDFLIPSIPQLVALLQDKVRENRILVSNTLLKLSQDHSLDFGDCIPQLQQAFKKLKGITQLSVGAILVNISRNYPAQVEILSKISKKLKKFANSSNFKISSLSRRYLSTIYKWNDDYGPAIKICLDLIKKYPLEENFGVLFRTAQIYHTIGDFKNAIHYFLEASKSTDAYIRLNSLIFVAYDYILQNSFREASNILNKTNKQYEKLSELLPSKRKRRIKLFLSYIKELAQFNFPKAKKYLLELSKLDNFTHKWEQRAEKNEFQNLMDIKQHQKQLTEDTKKVNI